MKKFLFLDCDSTLSAIEGIDELARLKGEQVFAEVERATNQAMDGKLPIDEIFARRLELICPSKQDCEKIGALYLKHLPDGLENALAELRAEAWEPVIISGGFIPCIQPLAAHLDIKPIEAVPLNFNDDGSYAGFVASPTTRNGGKPEIIESYLAAHPGAQSVMLGDGISDLECASCVDRFIACFTFVRRPALAEANCPSLENFAELPDLVRAIEAANR